MLSHDDQYRLDKLRLDRLRSEIPSLDGTITWLTLEHRLVITCLNAVQVDDLMIDVDQIEHSAWLILGVKTASIVFAGEQIWASMGDSVSVDLLLESIDFGEIESMSTATLEKPQSEQATEAKAFQSTNEPQPLRTLNQLAAELATITGGTEDEMRRSILDLNPPTYEYQGEYLLSPAYCDQAIDQWAQQLKQRLRNPQPSTNAEANGKASEDAIVELPAKTTAKKATTRQPAAKKPAAKRTPAKKATETTGE